MTWTDSYYSVSGYGGATWIIKEGQGDYYIYFKNVTYDNTVCNHPIPQLTLSGGLYSRPQ